MTGATTTNFLGIPVEGEIARGSTRTDQRPIEELEPLLRAVLDDPRIDAVGWIQYTPYFNDGEPCEFGVGQPWFATVGLPKLEADDSGADEELDEEEYDNYAYRYEISTYSPHPTLGGIESRRGQPDRPYAGPDEQLWKACRALSDAIGGGEFENVLLEAFGDHARVRVRATGITVDEYSHE